MLIARDANSIYNPQRVKEANPGFNLMCAERTFAVKVQEDMFSTEQNSSLFFHPLNGECIHTLVYNIPLLPGVSHDDTAL